MTNSSYAIRLETLLIRWPDILIWGPSLDLDNGHLYRLKINIFTTSYQRIKYQIIEKPIVSASYMKIWNASSSRSSLIDKIQRIELALLHTKNWLLEWM